MSEVRESSASLTHEKLPELLHPLLILVQQPNPQLFESPPADEPINLSYGETMTLTGDIPPQKLKALETVTYEPVFITSTPLDKDLETKIMPGYTVTLKKNFGPYRVYGLERTIEGESPHVVYPSRRDAVRGVNSIMENAHFEFITCEMDKEPPIPEEADKNRLYGLPKNERMEVQKYYKNLLENEFLPKLKQIQHTKEYPQQMFKGLEAIQQKVYTQSNNGDMNDTRWLFCKTYITPLVEYLDHRLHSPVSKEPQEELQDESLETVSDVAMDFDFIVNVMKTQALMLVGEQKEPHHQGVLIPFDKLQGATNYDGTSIWFTDKELAIYNRNKGVFTYPLPVKTPEGEIGFKGGIPRLIAKVLLEQSAAGELPPSDVDIVTFGKSDNEASASFLKETYDVEPKDIERIAQTGANGQTNYLGNRDQAINEVLLTEKGLVLSFNALSAFLQNTTEASADPFRDIFGRHIWNMERRYMMEGMEGHDIFITHKTRFPTPRALARMYRSLIEGKADSITLPRGALKLDIGIHWLVMAKKFLSKEDPERQNELLEKMNTLAYLVRSPYSQTMKGDSPEEFIENVKKHAPGGLEFDMDKGELSEKETLDWLAGRLVRQMMEKLTNYMGYDRVVKLERQLTEEDTLPIQITLPKPEEEKREEVKKNRHIPTLRAEKARAFFESFSYQDPANEEQAIYMQEWLEDWFPLSENYTRTTLFLIRNEAISKFYQAAERMNIIKRPDNQYGSSYSYGEYDAETNISWILAQKPASKMLLPLFEELFHSTGRHRINSSSDEGYVSSFENDTEIPDRGAFFEEGLAGRAWATFVGEHNLSEKEFIDPSIVSVWAGRGLTKILDSVGDDKRKLQHCLLRARIGDSGAEYEAKTMIDEQFGEGFFDHLLQIQPKDLNQMTELYEMVGLRS